MTMYAWLRAGPLKRTNERNLPGARETAFEVVGKLKASREIGGRAARGDQEGRPELGRF